MSNQSERRRIVGNCITWSGRDNRKGYGTVYVGKNKYKMAHRVVYEGCYGKIPEGMVIDHLCRNRSCVNPRHLEVVTNKENILRGISFSAINHKKTHCIKGHPFTEENTRKRVNNWRGCRICHINGLKQMRIRKKLSEENKL